LKLTFGYLYDFRNPPQWHRPWPELYAETLEFIAWTESIGLKGLGYLSTTAATMVMCLPR
jgi:hypothetical protein